MKYNIYGHEPDAIAVELGSEYTPDGRLIATVEATPYREFSPNSSAFQSSQTNEYIRTGLPWPYSVAVVVH